MKAPLLATEAVRCTAEIRNLAALVGSYSFANTSTWPHAAGHGITERADAAAGARA
mgnify:CR=1 FL=1